jgi:hypothetical protein
MDRRNGPSRWPQWHGWTVRTHDGAEVGAVAGRFDGGPHEGRLRVQRPVPGGTAVFAVPLSAIATTGSGTIRLTATAEVAEWLVYLVRRYLGAEGA